MNARNTHKRAFQEFATIGPREVADLARALPWLDTNELARILTAMPADARRLR